MDKFILHKQLLSGWGRYPMIDCNCYVPENEQELLSLIEKGALIARGSGRAYGDSALSKNLTVSMLKFNHFLDFDANLGILTVEAGVILKDVINTFLPKGWFIPVTPGTKYVSIGGMIAADVHGKNHHIAKTFGHYIQWLDLITSDGKIIRCSQNSNPLLFKATIGGMGLTGVIIRASFQMIKVQSAWLKQEIVVTKNFEETYNLFLSAKDATYVVAWVDCSGKINKLGRALVYFADHASPEELSEPYKQNPYQIPPKKLINIPFQTPISFVNIFTSSVFNKFNYLQGQYKLKNNFIDYDSYFYPLDNVLNWNKLYGRTGFAQFQCLIPIKNAKEGVLRLLAAVAKSEVGCFLSVLKLMGSQTSFFSFPDEGFTITFDLPLVPNKTIKLINILHAITLECSGRFYLAKDAHLDSKKFYDSDKRIEEFYKLRKMYNMTSHFRSEQSDRLDI